MLSIICRITALYEYCDCVFIHIRSFFVTFNHMPFDFVLEYLVVYTAVSAFIFLYFFSIPLHLLNIIIRCSIHLALFINCCMVDLMVKELLVVSVINYRTQSNSKWGISHEKSTINSHAIVPRLLHSLPHHIQLLRIIECECGLYVVRLLAIN